MDMDTGRAGQGRIEGRDGTRARQGRAGQGRGRTGQDRTGKDRAVQGRAGAVQ